MFESIVELACSSQAWIALLTLTFMEIILGIDNIIFISIIANKLNHKDQMQKDSDPVKLHGPIKEAEKIKESVKSEI
jgi:hypothetical protein